MDGRDSNVIGRGHLVSKNEGENLLMFSSVEGCPKCPPH